MDRVDPPDEGGQPRRCGGDRAGDERRDGRDDRARDDPDPVPEADDPFGGAVPPEERDRPT
jgi:hypothetical protein